MGPILPFPIVLLLISITGKINVAAEDMKASFADSETKSKLIDKILKF